MKPFSPTFYKLTREQMGAIKPDTDDLALNKDGSIDWDAYDYVLVSFSGGKDSVAAWLWLLELGCDPEKIQLWHQLVDGKLEPGDRNFFDWAVTESYCEAIAAALETRLRVDRRTLFFQWKKGGFEGEMLRTKSTTAAACFEDQDNGDERCVRPALPGKTCKKCEYVYKDEPVWDDEEMRYYVNVVICPQCETPRRNVGTRHKFPQIGKMTTRWCTSYLKIDVMARTINNDPEFKGARILMVTGERRQESNQRRGLAEIERHKSSSGSRQVTQWRPVIAWDEKSVYRLMERWKINPHPCYHLGFWRCSCITCIYGHANQWATVLEIDPELMEKIAAYEDQFKTTIVHPKKVTKKGNIKLIKTNVIEVAANGVPFDAIYDDYENRRLGMGTDYPVSKIFTEHWQIPPGAFTGGTQGGPG